MKRTLEIVLALALGANFQAGVQGTPPTSHNGVTLLEAVQSALSKHPLLKSQQAQIEIVRGLKEQASAPFDLVTQGNIGQQRTQTPLTAAQQEQNLPLGILATTNDTNNYSSTVGISKLFRTGITASTSVEISHTGDNIQNLAGINSTTTTLVLNIPIFRGRGRRVAAAQEEAAAAEVDGSLYDLNQLVSQLMLNSASSYWNWVASKKLLAIAQGAEERGKSYLANIQVLVDADHAPRNDLNEIRANLAQRSSARIAAEQQVVAAEQQLALDMGLSAREMAAWLSDPIDDFPEVSDQTTPSNEPNVLQYYLEQALQRRGDYLAAQSRVGETDILLKAARNRLLPQIDVNLGAGYTGAQGGLNAGSFFSSPTAVTTGPNVSVGLNYTFPSGNNAARGALRQAEGNQSQAEWQKRQVARNISATIVVAVGALRSAAFRVGKARESSGFFDEALSGEREKYRLGMGSVADILTLEDRLNNAQIDQIQAQLSYAIALAQFRFATGTLVSSGKAAQSVEVSVFLTLPFTQALPAHP